MDGFKRANSVDVTALDYNVPQLVKRAKGDGKKLRRLARHRMKQEDKKEFEYERTKENIKGSWKFCKYKLY